MPSVGRKFLPAGKGGLNLTHAERQPEVSARLGSDGAWQPWQGVAVRLTFTDRLGHHFSPWVKPWSVPTASKAI